MEIESVQCECCELKEDCTQEYIRQVKAKFDGKWICGLCSEAVRDEVSRGKKQSGMEEAVRAHMSFCGKFNSNPAVKVADGMKQMLRRRSGDLSSSKSSSKKYSSIRLISGVLFISFSSPMGCLLFCIDPHRAVLFGCNGSTSRIGFQNLYEANAEKDCFVSARQMYIGSSIYISSQDSTDRKRNGKGCRVLGHVFSSVMIRSIGERSWAESEGFIRLNSELIKEFRSKIREAELQRKIGYFIRKASTSRVHSNWTASAVQLDPNTWILEYESSLTLENSMLLSAVAGVFKYRMSRALKSMNPGFWLFSDFECQYSEIIPTYSKLIRLDSQNLHLTK
ncbi:hypothetical protein DKX38_013129 [Salix brachista]|uniref:DUF1677 domain-containing protein n=1 Tax=Salix brachista TaxID=2182728 RepID=A0A5N5LQI0_9ROSI|nr:hypothetical protein DKX38_013129 [Salix brachista]